MTVPVLSILIATQPSRGASFDRLLRMLSAQAADKPVEIIGDSMDATSTGAKRNRLLDRAVGDYIAFVDDDDLVSDDYVDKVLAACAQGPDCCSIGGWVTFDERPRKMFWNSLSFNEWGEDRDKFYRTPNHLNAVKRELALKARFPDLTIGEDHEYSRRLYPYLHSEIEIPGALYYYFCEPRVRAQASNLRFLLKWPTRGRPELFGKVLREHAEKLSSRNKFQFLVSVDADDPDWHAVDDALLRSPLEHELKVGPAGRSKIQAINADVEHATDWDVLVLLADDMVPVAQDWDEQIVVDMARNFPNLDGILVYDDGYAQAPVDPEEFTVATMPVMGRRFYDRQGYIYHPEYTSLWCDNELADVARTAGRGRRIPKVIIRHDWIGRNPDDLLRRNESFYKADKLIYDRRKSVGFPRGSSLSYSQNDEESAILSEVGAISGTLLDVGAYDGKMFSNSLRLIEQGWGGVLVEPSPIPFQRLLELHRDRPNVTLVQAALAPKAGFTKFSDSRGDAVSTMSDSHVALWSGAGVKWDEYMVRAVTPCELLAQVGFDFTFVSIDVEGVNIEVFRAFPWPLLARNGLRLICVEHEENVTEIDETLEPLGFERFYRNPENCMYRKRL